MGATGDKGTAAGAAPTEPEAFDFTKISPVDQKLKVKDLQEQMGQTGDEAGKYDLPQGSNKKMYVNCSKSFDINYYLTTGLVGSPQSSWTDFGGYDAEDITQDIMKMDKGMKPLPEAIRAYKYADGAALGRMLGDSNIGNGNIQALMTVLQNDPVAAADFTTRLQNTEYTHKGYTSMSYVPQHSTYDSMPVRLDFVARQGTKAIVTNNTPEHEIIGHRDAKYEFTGKFKVEEVYSTAAGKKIKQLVIECYI